ncbi:DNA methyltransferase [Enterococcus dongliensis]|uniref:DNA methyltransferase n=1 Tax=Enterococcus dongliensis TaxID=2559925 RepID=A0ABU3ERF4_9ENTE|nr:DNA methyltransferase [Enterococcus dongliensis]MDT2597445.1 DNA methyltransferase [Enterococcus dongliensis]MDT2643451.1 DNA methyltransferase [Enterococcus dongliensis]
MRNITILNYPGNKASLMPFISKNIRKYVSPGDTICDIFSGSGSVGSFLKDEYSIIANDAELYSAIISSALLNTSSKQELLKVKNIFLRGFKLNSKHLFGNHENIIAKERTLIVAEDNFGLENLYKNFPTIWSQTDSSINQINLKKNDDYNLFLYYYSGTYFGIEQSIAIDSIIKTIHEIEAPETKNVLFSCLFYAMKEVVFSKDGHMAQPLNIEKNAQRHIKQRRKNILEFFINKLDEFIESSSDSIKKNINKIFNLDMIDLLSNKTFNEQSIKLIYADPPYTDMQYSRYYHLLNVAAKYDYPEPTISRGNFTKGLYTEGRNQSELSKKSTAKNQLRQLFKYCNEKNIILALSYAYPKDEVNQKTDRYTVSIEELVDMAKETFGNKKVQIEEENYQHANHRNSSTKEVFEYLILCGQEIHRSNYDIISLKRTIKDLTPTSKNPIYNTHLYWSQKSFNVIDSLITHLSSKGDIIFDPFMGSGVTIIESVKNTQSRIGIGCDINEMPKFIVHNILKDIPNSNLDKIFMDFKNKLEKLNIYYETQCPNCKSSATITKTVFDKPSRTDDKFIIKAISYTCPNCGKQVKDADSDDYANLSTIKCDNYVNNQQLLQNSKIAVGKSDKISDIFTPRNFSVLNEIVGYIESSADQHILKYLLMSVLHLAKITDTHSNSQWPLWIPKSNCVEKNIVDLLEKRIKKIYKAKSFIEKNYSNSKLVDNFDEAKPGNAFVLTKGSQFITNDEVPDSSVSLIITDPPYMDQVFYSEYMQLYKPFLGLDYNLKDEVIVSSAPNRKRDKEEYFKLMNDVFVMCSKKLKENHILCLFFHDSNLNVWVNLMEILEKNGFKFISQEHIKKTKTVKNILSPKKSLSGDAILFFENTRNPLPQSDTSTSVIDIKHSVYLEAKKLLEKHGDLSTPELYDLGIMEMLIENGWLKQLSTKYKTLVEIFEEYFIWKRESAKWHLQK